MNSPTDNLLLKILSTIGSDTNTLGAASVGLIQAPFTPARGLRVSDLTEANYDGYTKKAAGFNTGITYISSDGFDYVESSSLLQFQPTGSATPNTIYGYFVTYGNDSTKLGYVEPISPPVTLNGVSTSINVIPRFGFNPTFSFGNGVVFS